MGQIPSQHKSDPLTDRVNLLVLNQTVGFTSARNSVTRFLVGKGRVQASTQSGYRTMCVALWETYAAKSITTNSAEFLPCFVPLL